MNVISASDLPVMPPSAVGPSTGGKAGKAKDAATQFEALLIEKMLQSARSGALSPDDGESGSALSEMAEQNFAQLLASNGGLGLAKLVESGLEKE